MYTVYTDIKCGLFASLLHSDFQFLAYFANHFFNAGRMYPSIIYQLLKSQPGHFTTHRIKTGQNNGLRERN